LKEKREKIMKKEGRQFFQFTKRDGSFCLKEKRKKIIKKSEKDFQKWF